MSGPPSPTGSRAARGGAGDGVDDPGGGDVAVPAGPGGRGRSHAARYAAIAAGGVLALLVVLLATRTPAEDRFGANPVVGRAVPAVSGPTLSGDTFDIDKQRGRWVVVNFFSTWCVPCRQEHPELVAFAREHAATGDASVVSIVYDDQASAVRQFFADKGGDWPVITGDTGRLALAFGVTGVPESYVVSPDGQVVAKFNGVTKAALDEVIASGSQAPATPATSTPNANVSGAEAGR